MRTPDAFLPSNPTTRDIPILVVTAHASARDRVSAEGSPEEILVKPVEPRKFIAAVKRTIAPVATDAGTFGRRRFRPDSADGNRRKPHVHSGKDRQQTEESKALDTRKLLEAFSV
jgi:DNA-binding response OmpR family regulator